MATNVDTILSIKADVYEASPPGSQTSWLPKASSVLVSICFDSVRNLCRVISVLDQTAIINSCITSTSQFIESSSRFGTWYDERNDTTFGVGFANESDLKAFGNAFNQGKTIMEELVSTMATSNLANSTESISTQHSSSGDLDQQNQLGPAKSISDDKNFHPFMSSDWLEVMTGTSRNGSLTLDLESKNIMLTNNNSDVTEKGSCNLCPLLPSLPNPNFTVKNDNEFVIMNISPVHPKEIKTVAQENSFLRKALTDASKNASDWQLELDSHRKLSEALSKAKEDALRLMEEWKSKSYDSQMEAKMWKERCERSENMAQNLAEDTISKYKQQLKDALSGKDYYKSVLQEKEMELRNLKEQLGNNETSTSHTTLMAYKKENESLKSTLARAQQQESNYINLANEQWTVTRDAESRLAEGIQRIIDVHTELKRSVKKGANWREQTP